MKRIFFAVEKVRGGKLLSEILAGNDHLLGYRGYILNQNQKLFTQETLEEGLVSMDDIKRIRVEATDIESSYKKVIKILRKKGATHCIYCNRTIDDCFDYAGCEKLTRI